MHCYECPQQIEPNGCGRKDEEDEADEADEEDEAVDDEDDEADDDFFYPTQMPWLSESKVQAAMPRPEWRRDRYRGQAIN